MVFLRFPWRKSVFCLFPQECDVDYLKIHQHVTSCLGTDDFFLYCGGRKLVEGEKISQDVTVQITFSLPGGKGGFGSMLRAIGAQIEKTTNREACRDLSGRRLRDINEEQRLKKWISKESERKAEKIRRRKERIERLKSKPKHNFVDFEYEKEISALPERIDDALSAGMQKANKRPTKEGEASTSAGHSKKKCLWMDEDVSSSSSSEPDSPDTTDSHEATNSDSQSVSCSDAQQGSKVADLPEDQIYSSKSADCEASSSSISSESMQQETSNATSSELLTAVLGVSEGKADDETSQQQQGLTLQNPNSETKVHMASSKPVSEEAKEPIDLLSYGSESELEVLGLDRLKQALIVRGLKCGGTVSDRAQRLWTVKNLKSDEYPSNLLAKKKK